MFDNIQDLLTDDEKKSRFLSLSRAKEILYADGKVKQDDVNSKKLFLDKLGSSGFTVEKINDTIDNRKKSGAVKNITALDVVLDENTKLRDVGIPSSVLNEDQFNYVLQNYNNGMQDPKSKLYDLTAELADRGVQLEDTLYNKLVNDATASGTSLDSNGIPLFLNGIKKFEPSTYTSIKGGLADIIKHPVNTIKATLQNIGSVVGLAEEGDAEKTLKENLDKGNVSGVTSELGADTQAKTTLIGADILSSLIPVAGWAGKVKWLSNAPKLVGLLSKAEKLPALGKFLLKSGAETAKTLAITEGDIAGADNIGDYIFGATIGSIGNKIAKGSFIPKSGEDLTKAFLKETDNVLGQAGLKGVDIKDKPAFIDAAKKIEDKIKSSNSFEEIVNKADEVTGQLEDAVSDVVIQGNKKLNEISGSFSKLRTLDTIRKDVDFLNSKLGQLTSENVGIIKDGKYNMVGIKDFLDNIKVKINSGDTDLIDIQNIKNVIGQEFDSKIFKLSGEGKDTEIAKRLNDSKKFYSGILGKNIGEGFEDVNNKYLAHSKLMEVIDNFYAKSVSDVSNIAKSVNKEKDSLQETVGKIINPLTYFPKENRLDLLKKTIKDISGLNIPEEQITQEMADNFFNSLLKEQGNVSKEGVVQGLSKVAESAGVGSGDIINAPEKISINK